MDESILMKLYIVAVYYLGMCILKEGIHGLKYFKGDNFREIVISATQVSL